MPETRVRPRRSAKPARRKAARSHPCALCGGIMGRMKLTHLDQQPDGAVTLFRNVPMGICRSCGFQVIEAEVLRRLEALRNETPEDILAVPVYKFA